MKPRTWTWMDRTDWGEGPWDGEPDKEQWTEETSGLPCLLVRNYTGALCGYVGIPPGHSWYECPPDSLSIGEHRPLTRKEINYADFAQSRSVRESVAFLPDAGDYDEWWMVGFDCGHGDDIQPQRDVWLHYGGISWRLYPEGATYKDVAFVKDECKLIALQAVAALGGGAPAMRAILAGLRELEA